VTNRKTIYVLQICIPPCTTLHKIRSISFLHPLLRGVSWKCLPPCKRPNRKLFPRINCSFPKTQSPIAKLSMYYKSAYHHAQHSPKSNRYLTYIQFSEASRGSARRRVNGQIASYLHELIVLSRKRSNPSLKYLCFTNPHTTMHNTSQNLIDIFPTSTSQRRLMEVLAAV